MVPNSKSLDVANAVEAFLSEAGRNYEFPCGGSLTTLTKAELLLLREIDAWPTTVDAKLEAISQFTKDWKNAYKLNIFCLRCATQATRGKEAVNILTAITPLFTSSLQGIDWRDRLRSLAVFQHCCGVLSYGFDKWLQQQIELHATSPVGQVLKGFAHRSKADQTPESLALCIDQTPDGIMFRSIF